MGRFHCPEGNQHLNKFILQSSSEHENKSICQTKRKKVVTYSKKPIKLRHSKSLHCFGKGLPFPDAHPQQHISFSRQLVWWFRLANLDRKSEELLPFRTVLGHDYVHCVVRRTSIRVGRCHHRWSTIPHRKIRVHVVVKGKIVMDPLVCVHIPGVTPLPIHQVAACVLALNKAVRMSDGRNHGRCICAGREIRRESVGCLFIAIPKLDFTAFRGLGAHFDACVLTPTVGWPVIVPTSNQGDLIKRGRTDRESPRVVERRPSRGPHRGDDGRPRRRRGGCC